jgi:hypothetical protein
MSSLTVVFTINDQKAFDASADKARLFELFGADESAPFRIHAMSRDDEVHRAQLIDEAREKYGHLELAEAIEYVMQYPNLDEFSWEAFDAA